MENNNETPPQNTDTINNPITQPDPIEMNGLVMADKIIFNLLDTFDEKRFNRANGVKHPTGFFDIDNMIGGWRPGALVVLASEKRMGTTSLVLDFIRQYLKLEQTVAIFALGHSSHQIMERIIAAEAEIELQKLKDWALGASEEDIVLSAIRRVMAYGINRFGICQTPIIKIDELIRQCKDFKGKRDLKLVFIDDLFHVRIASADKTNQDKQASVLKELKNLAIELGITIIVRKQMDSDGPLLNEPGSKINKESDDASLVSADIIMMLNRKSNLPDSTGDTEIDELHIKKNNHGSVGVVKLIYLPKSLTFRNFSTRR